MKVPFFSIIIPTYNNLRCLRKCLVSIKKQTFIDFDVWVIDNASSDGTYEFVESLGAPFNVISENDVGIYNAMNKGIINSSGEWLYFMGADDLLYDTDVLAKVVNTRRSTEKVILGNVTFDLIPNESKHLNIKRSKFSKMLWFKNTIHHQGTFYKRDIFKNNFYDESYSVLADYKLNLELFRKKIASINTNILIAHCGDQGISKKFNWSLYKEDIRLKTEVSSGIFKPFFWAIGVFKYLMKN